MFNICRSPATGTQYSTILDTLSTYYHLGPFWKWHNFVPCVTILKSCHNKMFDEHLIQGINIKQFFCYVVNSSFRYKNWVENLTKNSDKLLRNFSFGVYTFLSLPNLSALSLPSGTDSDACSSCISSRVTKLLGKPIFRSAYVHCGWSLLKWLAKDVWTVYCFLQLLMGQSISSQVCCWKCLTSWDELENVPEHDGTVQSKFKPTKHMLVRGRLAPALLRFLIKCHLKPDNDAVVLQQFSKQQVSLDFGRFVWIRLWPRYDLTFFTSVPQISQACMMTMMTINFHNVTCCEVLH